MRRTDPRIADTLPRSAYPAANLAEKNAMPDISCAQLRAARALVGTSQPAVAQALRISADTIWRVEVGRGTERTEAQLEVRARR